MCLSLRSAHSVNGGLLGLLFSKLAVTELGIDAGFETVVCAHHLTHSNSN